MNEHLRVIFAPVLPASLLEALALAALLIVVYGVARRAHGGLLRGLSFALLLLALANPSLIEEQRTPLKDTVLLVVDDSLSMKLGDRLQQTARVLDSISKILATYPDLDIESLHIKGTEETDFFHALEGKLASIPRERLAGVIALTDGEIHDKPENTKSLGAPMHLLVAGHHDEIDRRLVIKEAPAYGIVGKHATLTLRIEDYPKPQSATARVIFRHGNGGDETFTMPVGEDTNFDVSVDHGGPNLFAFSAEPLPNELTPINNSAAISINGIRDRLRVLLISGEPHIGERTWRNFLKSDPAVDLVHFTILRSPNKMDGTPNNELALIAFPVHELFDVKLRSFDLVIFDRFRRQSLIPDDYLENIASYVEQGGALLISNATNENIPQVTFSPLARVLPAEPTGHLLTGSFVPDLSPAGLRHPVTAGLSNDIPQKDWGPWFRQIDAHAKTGEVLMTGLNKAPLLVLARVGKGRVAQFLSDQFWLWGRGYMAGGPQAGLLKRTAHWLVGEPELDETALRAHAEATDEGWQLFVSKQSLSEGNTEVSVTDPDDQQSTIILKQGQTPGVLQAEHTVSKTGLYRLREGVGDAKQDVLVMVGPVNAPEFSDMHATDEKLAPTIKASGGGIFWLEDKPNGPEIKRTGASGSQSGWGWIGLKRNDQYRVSGSKAYPLWPAWIAVIVLLGASLMTWHREGR